jgi:hypothetical protein
MHEHGGVAALREIRPFGMDELLARMRAALRHQLQVHGERPVFRTGDLAVDLVRRIVKVGDKEVKLSPRSTTFCASSCNMPARCSPTNSCSANYGMISPMPSTCGLCAAIATEDRSRSRAAAIRADGNGDRIPVAGAGPRVAMNTLGVLVNCRQQSMPTMRSGLSSCSDRTCWLCCCVSAEADVVELAFSWLSAKRSQTRAIPIRASRPPPS